MTADNPDLNSLPTPPSPRFRRDEDRNLQFRTVYFGRTYTLHDWVDIQSLLNIEPVSAEIARLTLDDAINAAIVAFEVAILQDHGYRKATRKGYEDMVKAVDMNLLSERAQWWAARERIGK